MSTVWSADGPSQSLHLSGPSHEGSNWMGWPTNLTPGPHSARGRTNQLAMLGTGGLMKLAIMDLKQPSGIYGCTWWMIPENEVFLWGKGSFLELQPPIQAVVALPHDLTGVFLGPMASQLAGLNKGCLGMSLCVPQMPCGPSHQLPRNLKFSNIVTGCYIVGCHQDMLNGMASQSTLAHEWFC